MGADLIEIVPFSTPFQNQVVDMILEIQQKEFEIPTTAKDQPDLATIPDFYQTGIGNFWLALRSQDVVGTISLLDIGNQQAALRKMFVKKEFRGYSFSVAGKLLNEALDWSGSHNIRDIFLGTTPKFLAAHRFYEKKGFELIAKSTLPPNFPIMEVDTRFYRYRV